MVRRRSWVRSPSPAKFYKRRDRSRSRGLPVGDRPDENRGVSGTAGEGGNPKLGFGLGEEDPHPQLSFIKEGIEVKDSIGSNHIMARSIQKLVIYIESILDSSSICRLH